LIHLFDSVYVIPCDSIQLKKRGSATCGMAWQELHDRPHLVHLT
jgi:hypothetical protein